MYVCTKCTVCTMSTGCTIIVFIAYIVIIVFNFVRTASELQYFYSCRNFLISLLLKKRPIVKGCNNFFVNYIRYVCL